MYACVRALYMCLRERVLCIPVYALHHNENLLPGSVGSRLPVCNSISQQLLQTLHVYNNKKKPAIVG